MSVDGAIAQGRSAAESRMTSTCAITRPGTGSPTYGPDGDQIVSETVVYDGPCRVAGAARGGTGARRLQVGNTESELALRVLHLPAGTTGLKDADTATITTGECAGLILRLIEVNWQDQATALRISCVEA